MAIDAPGPARIGRDLTELKEVFRLTGRVAGPSELRSDAGVQIVYDTSRILLAGIGTAIPILPPIEFARQRRQAWAGDAHDGVAAQFTYFELVVPDGDVFVLVQDLYVVADQAAEVRVTFPGAPQGTGTGVVTAWRDGRLSGAPKATVWSNTRPSVSGFTGGGYQLTMQPGVTQRVPVEVVVPPGRSLAVIEFFGQTRLGCSFRWVEFNRHHLVGS